MRQVKEYDQVTRESKVVTYLSISENGVKREMKLRHALQAMRVQPERFKLAEGEKLPEGISVSMVPPGTTMDDVDAFERTRGQVGKVDKSKFDDVLTALESGMDITDAVNVGQQTIRSGSMMDENAPPGYKPEGVDLEPSDSMKEDSGELSDTEKALDEKTKEEPKLDELKEKELQFDAGADAIADYVKEDLKDLQKDKLQAILITLPGFQKLAEKMQKVTIKANKAGLINSIVQLSKKKK